MERKRKILFIIPSMGIGGAEVFCANLVEEFSKKTNYDVHLIVFFNIISEKFEKQLKSNVKIHILNKKPGFSLRFIKTLSKAIKEISPDIINSHSSHSLRYLLLLNRVKRIPLIHTITNDPKIHDKICFFLFKRRMHQKSWNNITFVGISKLISDNLASVYNYPREKICTIYNGLHKLTPSTNIIAKKYDFFNCANFIPVKRHDLLLKALSKTRHNANLCIAGDGQEKEKLLKLASDLGIAERVDFKGSVLDPTDLYFSSKCFILTSFSEGNPISINEAMSAGIPVIATNVGGIPDLISNKKNGFLFERDDSPETIAEIMDLVLDLNLNELNAIKNNNQKKVKQWYMDEITNQYNKLIDSKLYMDKT